jgi:hypothetical protein
MISFFWSSAGLPVNLPLMLFIAHLRDRQGSGRSDVQGLALAMKNIESVIARARAERRRFKRVRVDLPGKLFVPDNGQESLCTVVNLSPGGALVECELALEPETPIVLYINGFGRFEGTVVRRNDRNHGVGFICTALKRERTIEQLTLFINRDLVDAADLRRNDRTPTKGLTRFTRADGQLVPCEVLDLSMSGISVKTDVRPPIGEFVLIGQMAGRIARHHDEGVGIEFVGGTGSNVERLRAKLSMVR